ncbi:MAG: DNA-binding response regulator [Candidatus Schekmanbacteria bacterium RIFCSPHIGHO2_02_FULL_38_11]|uniref:DNA-binding response regulator n=1 Tax=Candidatus Schekmanbacteria bacterium RIFCSPLOWO2_12_FULL_38_15 TaxID=1817883 RepID=A0A1F7SH68_9BACT|nr:MAG: DNA-binding response regulator [Candidatus Schekmanbacteria bacterium GWA2_38_9]OGL48936.1 MAG: DNA-binding response regulator [Candidatus Schekmanbacteria bacterium RIFCSPLOWO2_02_FULL_38_14]OGL50400.1 MAG: DNA-binding response regulator [Candidatus Schekmanbacteria bacterium RIFCSPHIGHO2_02_FULL_38_11]OGL53132.1 MAG: DNA-binding response regulator [Candidatus Schekmanbacteria bacterium RIFCSPLOWO2_12_FULL_38_15]
MPKKILIIEDEKDIAELVKHYLEKDNFETLSAFDGEKGLELVKKQNPDVVILDLMLPKIDGIEVCKRIRSDSKVSNVPIIMLTAKGDESDRIIGLELGADDYITKPFSPKELVARVKALLRRIERGGEKQKVYKFKNLTLNLESHEVLLDKNQVKLTSKEFWLLEELLRNKERVLTRDKLLNDVWGYDYYGTTRTIDVHIRRLREKLPGISDHIVTVKQLGYKFKENL